jgi:probable F420-dependent oxidoreductase
VRYWINALLVPAAQLVPLAQAADRLGYAGIALADHAVMPERIESAYPGGTMPWNDATDWPDPWVQIGAMASVTTRLRFATNVYVLPARHPLVTAKAVATAAALSADRVVLGVGVGWMAEEFEALGADFSNRGARTDEIIALLRALWRGETVEHHGSFYDVPRLRLRPAPGAPVPVWIGGESPAALRRAARLGDGWISGRSAETAAGQIPLLQQLRHDAGRQAEAFDIAVSAQTQPSAAEVDAMAALGITQLKVQPWHWYAGDPERVDTKLHALERFAMESGL